jgi:hypothetical protein
MTHAPIDGQAAVVGLEKFWVIYSFAWACLPCEFGKFAIGIKIWDHAAVRMKHPRHAVFGQCDTGATADTDAGFDDP